MKRPGPLFYNVLIFVFAQLIWFSLLGLWIYWYVSNYLIMNKISPGSIPQTTNIIALVSGLALMVMLSLSMSLIFIYANRQLNLNRLYDTFISNVTHELKSPLSSIQLYLETMQKRSLPEEKKGEFIHVMLADIDRLNHLINSILYLSALEQRKMTRKMRHDYSVYDAESMLRNVIGETKAQFRLPPGALQLTGSAKCQCVADRFWLKMVFDNLVDNAIKYSLNPVEIRVEMNCTNKHVIITFSDKGLGITPGNQKKIFHKFQRISNPESPNVKGTGLGLYWVKQIIANHGGTISVESAGLNQGTTFKIKLPIYQASKNWYIKRLLKMSKKDNVEEESVHDQEH